MSSIVGSRYREDVLAPRNTGVIGSGIPYYLDEEKYSLIDQVKSLVNCLLINIKNKK